MKRSILARTKAKASVQRRTGPQDVAALVDVPFSASDEIKETRCNSEPMLTYS
ncbi:hypothetical protein [Lederbergia citri]|uniref:Uncharacterized protein n=1 Tax=Lederbergia citri TaxID=2833580 RepID=A0A942TDG8_9BACI|nr:hypothetical protein [Lederbergia citri]MBS4194788.1 hypothetical protein [Lederbergia citri]